MSYDTKKLARIKAACRTTVEYTSAAKYRDMAKATLETIEHCQHAIKQDPDCRWPWDILQSIADSFTETSLP